MLNSASQHLYDIHLSPPRHLSSKKSLLLTHQILGLLVNTFAIHEKYPVLTRENLTIPIQMQLSKKKTTFSQFLAVFLKSSLNFKYFAKKEDPHRFCISEIMDCENVVRWTSQKSLFKGPFEKQHGKRTQALLKSSSQHLYHIHLLFPRQLSSRKSLLLTCQVLGLLVNALAAERKYPVLNRDNLKITIQMQLSQKQKHFFPFFAAFLKFKLNFKCFEEKNDPHRIFDFAYYGLWKRN